MKTNVEGRNGQMQAHYYKTTNNLARRLKDEMLLVVNAVDFDFSIHDQHQSWDSSEEPDADHNTCVDENITSSAWTL